MTFDLAAPREIMLRAAWLSAPYGLDDTEHVVTSDAATLFCSCTTSSGEALVSTNGQTSALSHGSLLVSSTAPSLVPDSRGSSDAGAMIVVGRYELCNVSDRLDEDCSAVSGNACVDDDGVSHAEGVKFLCGGKLHPEASQLRKRFGMPISLGGYAAFSGRWGDAA